jgi:hypothetical protein
MKKLIVALAAVALLGGCVKIDKSPPKDLPAYVTIYPGATSVVSMSMVGMSSMLFQSASKPDDVVAYYRTQASSNGLTEQSTANTSTANTTAGQRQAIFGDQSGKMLVVVAKPQGDGSMVTVMYKPLPKAAS